jgi:hypothetical protein
MEDFDPDKYLEGGGGDFDPDAYLGNTPSALTSGIRKAASGLTGGFLDELSGAGEAAGRAVGIKGLGGEFSDVGLADDGPTLDWETLRDAYRKARDRKRAALDADSKYNPGASMAGELAGAVASPINKIGKGLSLASQGAALGGITALGGSEAEDLSGMLTDTAAGTAIGGVVWKAVDTASPIIQKGIDKLGTGARDLAERFGARALGAERGSIKSLGFDKVKNAAGQMLDEGGFSPLASTDDLISRNQAIKDRGGEMMGKAYGAIDDAGASTFNPLDVASKMDEELGGFWRSPLNKAEASQFDNTIEAILMRGDKNIPLSEAQALKEELGRAANWKNSLQVSPKEQMARDAYRLVNQSIDDAVEQGADAVNSAGLRDTLAKGKELFGNASTAEKLLENKMAREQGNRLIGLTDAVTGAGALGYGGTTGDWQSAGGLMLAKKGLEKYGAQNAALGLNKISKALMRSPKMADLAQRSPPVFNAIAQKMEQSLGGLGKAAEAEKKPYDQNAVLDKARGSKFEQVLQQAAQRGENALGATHFILQNTDPEYRRQMNDNEEEYQ